MEQRELWSPLLLRSLHYTPARKAKNPAYQEPSVDHGCQDKYKKSEMCRYNKPHVLCVMLAVKINAGSRLVSEEGLLLSLSTDKETKAQRMSAACSGDVAG